jgi:hypothetical protein
MLSSVYISYPTLIPGVYLLYTLYKLRVFRYFGQHVYINFRKICLELLIIIQIWSPKWKPNCDEILTNLFLAKHTNLGKKRSKLNIGVRAHAKSVVVLGHQLGKFSRVTQFH